MTKLDRDVDKLLKLMKKKERLDLAIDVQKRKVAEEVRALGPIMSNMGTKHSLEYR